MEGVIGVRFTAAGPLTYCAPGELAPALGDYVVVRTRDGERLGWVVITPDQVIAAQHEGPLRVIERLATESDVQSWREQRTRAEEDIGRAQELAARSDPRLRVATIEYDLAGERCQLTFTAPERLDQGWFQREACELLGAAVTVRQVGDRDRAKAAGGLGVCGLNICCATWMTEFPTISMKMAKDQDLPPNPSKISGVCGRLLCCLSFEVEQYRELRGGLPKVGRKVTTPVGRAKVLSISTLKQLVRLRIEETGEVVELPAEEVRRQYGTAVRPAELEESVEDPARRQDRQRKDNLVAVLEPVDAPPDGVAPAAPATSEQGEEASAAKPEPRRRRRRGRRGGRRRGRGDGGSSGGGARGDG